MRSTPDQRPALDVDTGLVAVPAAHVDQPDDRVPPWTRPVDPDYSWDPDARPVIPAEGTQVELGAVA